MPSHHYTRVPIEDEALSYLAQPPSYFTGLPSTAPPSFHTIELNSSTPSLSQVLPHRNDETATTLIPHNQRQAPIPTKPQTSMSESGTDDGGISLWAPSEDSSEEDDANARRDDILIRLMDRMEAMERHFATTPMNGKEETDLEAAKEKAERKKWWSEVWTTIAVTLFMIWFLGVLGTTIVLSAWQRHSGGEKMN